MKKRIVTKNRIYTIAIIVICLTLTACGGGSSTAASGDSGGGGSENSGGGTFESEYHDAEFHEDSAWIILIDQFFKCFSIIYFRMYKARYQRCKYLLSFCQAGGRHSCQCSSMERLFK